MILQFMSISMVTGVKMTRTTGMNARIQNARIRKPASRIWPNMSTLMTLMKNVMYADM